MRIVTVLFILLLVIHWPVHADTSSNEPRRRIYHDAYPHPSDYKITIFDLVVDTSSTLLGASSIPMMFLVWNLTQDRKSDILFIDTDDNKIISLLDNIYILEQDDVGELGLTWQIQFTGAPDDTLHLPPQPGDEFIFRTLKPITSKDVYEFRATLTNVDEHYSISLPEKFTLLQNYPNPFNPSTTISFHLPKKSKVVLKIYNLIGEQVRTLVHSVQLAGEKSVVWDGRDRYDQELASGVYIYHLQAGSEVQSRKMLLVR